MNKRSIQSILKAWNRKYLLIGIGLSLLISAMLFAIAYCFDFDIQHAIILSVISSVATLSVTKILSPTMAILLSLLNHEQAETEFSSFLLNQKDSELTGLQKLQKAKILDRLQSIKVKFPFDKKIIFTSIGALAISTIVLSALNKNHTVVIDKASTESPTQKALEKTKASKDSLRIEDILLFIQVPEYTKLKNYRRKDLAIEIPEQSKVTWTFNLNGEADQKQLIFEDEHILELDQHNKASKKFDQASFYQYLIAKEGQKDLVSKYYPIKVIADKSPVVKVTGQDSYQILEYRENHNIKFDIRCTDDYGLSEVVLSATLAKGSGEAVKFREKQIELEDFRKGSNSYNSSYTFSTKELGMAPGDELYFFVGAKDNCPFETHWSRSTTYFIVLEDTASIASIDAGGMQLDLMPDFFRSQRQIIIDTEKLIADKDTIDPQEFKERSNELGYDQKLLRIKYGQFLGEEAESGIDIENEIEMEGVEEGHEGHHHAEEDNKVLNEARSLINQFMHDHDHEEEENQLLESKGAEKLEEIKNPDWVEELSHSHDNMEEATFFDVSIKGKLRAALTQMWDSELHLRLFDPETSLPYQYKSLHLLDDIKNHARVYVQRIGFEPPAIKEQESRLTGELKDAYSTRDILKEDLQEEFNYLKRALPFFLDKIDRPQMSFTDLEQSIMQMAGKELSTAALQNSEYLPALSTLKACSINSKNISKKDLKTLITVILDIIPKDKKEVSSVPYFRHPINTSVISEFKKSD